MPKQKKKFSVNYWMQNKCLSYYADRRIELCNFMQRLDINFPAPICYECRTTRHMDIPREPDVSPRFRDWEEDLDWTVGSGTSEFVQEQLRIDSNFFIQCKLCPKELRPWERDELYVEQYSFEELYSLPIVSPDQLKATRSLKEYIYKYYGKKCFNCGSANNLHIDHINPRYLDGNAIFTNLQPLCIPCGQLKGDSACDDIGLTDPMLFGPYPHETCEDLFW